MRSITVSSFALMVLVAGLSAEPEGSRDAHMMLSVSEPGPRGIARQSEFSKQAKPGAGKELRLWIESGCGCRAVVAAFNHDGRMAYDGPPSEIEVKEHSNNQVPAAGGRKWTWDGHENLAEMDIVFIAGESPDTRDLSKLLEAMRDASVSEAVRKRQAADLRRWIDAHTQNTSSAADYSVKPTPVAIGGMVRGEDCDWCKSAQRVSIPANGFVIVRIHID